MGEKTFEALAKKKKKNLRRGIENNRREEVKKDKTELSYP